MSKIIHKFLFSLKIIRPILTKLLPNNSNFPNSPFLNLIKYKFVQTPNVTTNWQREWSKYKLLVKMNSQKYVKNSTKCDQNGLIRRRMGDYKSKEEILGFWQ
jgi:hypothetical protein